MRMEMNDSLNESKPLKLSATVVSYETGSNGNKNEIASKNQNDHTSDLKMHKREHFYYFFVLVYAITFFGTGLSLFGLSIIEFSKNLNSSIEQISFGLTIGFISGIFGCLLATFTLDRWNRQLQFALCNLILSANFMIFPFLTSLTFYLVNQAISGLIIPIMNTIPSVWIMEMFDKESKIYLQIMHVFFPIGQSIGPFIYVPFIGSENNSTTNLDEINHVNLSKDHNSTLNQIFDTLFSTTKYSNVWIPFLIVSVFKASVSLLIIIGYIVKPYQKPTKIIDLTTDDQQFENILEKGKKNISKKYLIIFVFLISLLFGIQIGNEFNATTFISTYLQKSELKLDEKTAAYCQSILSTSTTAGRIVNVFLTMKIKSHTMLFINYIFMILGNCILMTIGNYSIVGIYFGISLLGYGFSNAFPMIVSFVDERVSLSNKIMSIMNFSSAILMAASPFILGRFLDTNPSYFIILNLVVTSFAFLIFILLVILEGLRLSKRI